MRIINENCLLEQSLKLVNMSLGKAINVGYDRVLLDFPIKAMKEEFWEKKMGLVNKAIHQGNGGPGEGKGWTARGVHHAVVF